MSVAARIASSLLLACMAFGAWAQAADASQERENMAGGWRGTVVPPFPSGVRELAGTCIGEGTSGDAICAIAVSVLRDEQSELRTILATRRLHHPDGTAVGGDRPLSLVTDALEPAALDDEGNEVAVGLCQRDGRDDPRIVAIVRPDAGQEWFTSLQGTWRVDDDGRFAGIPAAGVRCRNEGFGYDG